MHGSAPYFFFCVAHTLDDHLFRITFNFNVTIPNRKFRIENGSESSIYSQFVSSFFISYHRDWISEIGWIESQYGIFDHKLSKFYIIFAFLDTILGYASHWMCAIQFFLLFVCLISSFILQLCFFFSHFECILCSRIYTFLMNFIYCLRARIENSPNWRSFNHGHNMSVFVVFAYMVECMNTNSRARDITHITYLRMNTKHFVFSIWYSIREKCNFYLQFFSIHSFMPTGNHTENEINCTSFKRHCPPLDLFLLQSHKYAVLILMALTQGYLALSIWYILCVFFFCFLFKINKTHPMMIHKALHNVFIY